MTNQTNKFDYSILDAQTADKLKGIAEYLKSMKGASSSLIRQAFNEAKILIQNTGIRCFVKWVKSETTYNFTYACAITKEALTNEGQGYNYINLPLKFKVEENEPIINDKEQIPNNYALAQMNNEILSIQKQIEKLTNELIYLEDKRDKELKKAEQYAYSIPLEKLQEIVRIRQNAK